MQETYLDLEIGMQNLLPMERQMLLAKIYHYVLTPIEGLNTLILYPNMLLTFIFTINTVSGNFKWNII